LSLITTNKIIVDPPVAHEDFTSTRVDLRITKHVARFNAPLSRRRSPNRCELTQQSVSIPFYLLPWRPQDVSPTRSAHEKDQDRAVEAGNR
jgi:hypothetical protein